MIMIALWCQFIVIITIDTRFSFQVPCAFVVLAVVAVVASTSPAQNYQFAPKAAVPSSEALKSVSTPSPVPVQPFAYSGLDAARQYPPHSYQFSSEYTSPFSRSAFGPKSAAAPSQYGKSKRVLNVAKKIKFFFAPKCKL